MLKNFFFLSGGCEDRDILAFFTNLSGIRYPAPNLTFINFGSPRKMYSQPYLHNIIPSICFQICFERQTKPFLHWYYILDGKSEHVEHEWRKNSLSKKKNQLMRQIKSYYRVQFLMQHYRSRGSEFKLLKASPFYFSFSAPSFDCAMEI